MRMARRTRGPNRSWNLGVATAILVHVVAMLGGSPARSGAQTPLDAAAGLTVEGAGVEAALQLLGRSSGVSLVFSPDLLPRDRVVTCRCADLTVREALRRILIGTGLTFRSAGRNIRIVPAANGTPGAQTGEVVGRVVAADADEPVVNALVRLDDGPGVLSGRDGSFRLRSAPPGAHSLRVTSLGWAERVVDGVQVEAAGTTEVVVRLERAVIPLPEILVAPGTFRLLEEVSPGGARTLSRDEIQTMPQVGEDVFRAMKRLPGVSSHDISTKLNIRGGASSEVMLRLDGLELYEPYHLKDWDGAVGIVDLNALGGVELTTGGFGAEYGDRMAGVLDMRSRTETGQAKTTLGLSVTNVTAMSRGAFADGKGAWLASARRGFMGIVIKLTGGDDRISPQYYDLFGKVSWAPNAKNVFTAHVLQAGDHLGLHEREVNGLEGIDFDSGWDSSYGWVTWEASPHRRVRATTMAWTGRVTRRRHGMVADFGRPDMPDSVSALDDRLFTFAGLRQDLGVELSDRALLAAGVDVRALHADYAYRASTVTQVLLPDGMPGLDRHSVDLAPDDRGSQVGAYFAARVRPVPALSTEVGVRYDRMSHTGDENVAPRVLAALDLGERTTLRGSWGRYFQSHGIQELEVADGELVYYPAERSDQVAVGIQHSFRGGVDARVELYRRDVGDQRPRFINLEQDLRIFPEVEGDRLRVDPGRGRMRGVELTVERRTGRRWDWWASYALAVAEDEYPDLEGGSCTETDPCADGPWVPRQYDQRHTVGLQVTYRPAPAWDVSWAWAYHSGWPVTLSSYELATLADGNRFWVRSFEALRGSRLPAYHRLDVRVTRDMTVRGGTLRAYLDLFNVYDRTNVASYRYDFRMENGTPVSVRRNGLTLMPLLPTIGFRYEF
jgi:hypothetical protein